MVERDHLTDTKRMGRERHTITSMIHIYCRGHHRGRTEPCPECRELLVYAGSRLDLCPFREGKLTCAKCPVHCYQSDMRATVREVVQYSGPWMMLNHPLLAWTA